MKIETKIDPISANSSSIIFLVALKGKHPAANLNIVIASQNKELKFIAYCFVATCPITT
jgi:hypothetical protein